MPFAEQLLPSSRETDKREQVTATPSSSCIANQLSPKVHSLESIDSTDYQELYGLQSKRMGGPPALPQKSALRASKILDDKLNATNANAQPNVLTHSMPYDVYLSSEEEASSSADDFSDYEADDEVAYGYDSGSEDSPKSPLRCKGHEDVAKVVSFIFCGRPSIIDVPVSRRSTSPASVNPRPRPSVTGVSDSVSTSPRPSTSPGPALAQAVHPPRSSSIMAPRNKLIKPSPEFLKTDPFPHQGGYETMHTLPEDEVPRTPKSPTAVFKSVSRTFSLSRKRSRSRLSSLHSSGVSSALSSTPEHSKSSGLEPTHNSQTKHSVLDEPTLSTSPQAFVLQSEHVNPRSSTSSHESPLLPPPPPPPPPLMPPPLPPRTASTPSVTVKGLLSMARRRTIHSRAFPRA